MDQPQPARLEDIISYTPETYFSEEELALVRSSFNGPQGAKLLKVVRKALIPSVSDPDLPVEEYSKDMFMFAADFHKLQDSEVKPVVMGLQFAVKVTRVPPLRLGGRLKSNSASGHASSTFAPAADAWRRRNWFPCR